MKIQVQFITQIHIKRFADLNCKYYSSKERAFTGGASKTNRAAFVLHTASTLFNSGERFQKFCSSMER